MAEAGPAPTRHSVELLARIDVLVAAYGWRAVDAAVASRRPPLPSAKVVDRGDEDPQHVHDAQYAWRPRDPGDGGECLGIETWTCGRPECTWRLERRRYDG